MIIRKVNLRRVRLNQGGYTDKGKYFGIDRPLFNYWYEARGGYEIINKYLRANNREHARTLIELELKRYGYQARFYR